MINHTSSVKVIHYLPRLDPREGGVYSFVVDLVRVMSRHGVSSMLCTKDASGSKAVDFGPEADRVEIVELRSQRPLRLIDRESFDRCLDTDDCILHLHGAWDLENVRLARWAAARRAPVVLSTHGMLDDWSMQQSRLKKRLFLRLFRRHFRSNCSVVLSTALGEQRQSSRYFDEPLHRCLPAPIDLSRYEALPGESLIDEYLRTEFGIRPAGEKVRLLYLGRIDAKKRPDIAIAALERVKAMLPGLSIELLVAGSLESRYARGLAARCEQMSDTERVHFLGHIDGALKRSLLQSADMFLLPTSQENFGIAIFEAMACGLPVITTKGVDVWPELLSSGGAAVVAPTPSAFAEEIAALASHPSRRQEMSEASRPWVLEYLDPTVLACGYERVYSEALQLMTQSTDTESRL